MPTAYCQRIIALSPMCVISTAGESFEIPGLAEENANELRDRVAELARLAKEDV